MTIFVRALICAAVVLSGSPATAQKVPFENSANALFQGCKAATQNEKLDPQTATVASYCNGVIYALASVSDRLSNPLERSCVPAISMGQTMRVVVKFLDDHPERLHENFVQLTLEAFHQAWPCPPR
jgi:Ssp1 endopeptidase immunity protein Rap1a